MHSLDLYIKIIIFLFYYYIRVHVFNSSWLNILVQISYFLCWSTKCIWWTHHNMSFFISYPLSALVHISSLEPNRRLSSWYHHLGLIKGMIWKMPCTNIFLSARLGHSCETWWSKHDSPYYSKQNSKFYHRVKF